MENRKRSTTYDLVVSLLVMILDLFLTIATFGFAVYFLVSKKDYITGLILLNLGLISMKIEFPQKG